MHVHAARRADEAWPAQGYEQRQRSAQRAYFFESKPQLQPGATCRHRSDRDFAVPVGHRNCALRCAPVDAELRRRRTESLLRAKREGRAVYAHGRSGRNLPLEGMAGNTGYTGTERDGASGPDGDGQFQPEVMAVGEERKISQIEAAMTTPRKRIEWAYVTLFGCAVTLLLLAFPTHQAQAVPSFARQTGLACSSCHTNPPELTPLGRTFKLNGYTMTGIKMISSPPEKQNWNYSVPQDASLFLAGAYGSHIGGFVQATYDAQADHFSWDNTDIRYANNRLVKGKTLVYGLDVNNNPTVEDLWNDTPAWGFSWIVSPSAPTPAAAAVIDGPLAQDVAGFGGYAMWNDHLYGAATIYRSSHLGQPLPNPGTNFNFNIQGAAPYWRAAWQQTVGNSFFESGGYGMHMRSTPGAITGPENIYTDLAADAQFEQVLPRWHNNLISLHTTSFRVNAVYHFGYRYAPAFQYFMMTGVTDPVEFGPGSFSGSANGSPNSKGY